jgi:hypothetical protein
VSCTHERRWSTWEAVEVGLWGETEQRLVEHWQSTNEDLDTGRFRCTQCGEIGYYTGLWKRFFEEGIPCAGSERLKPCKS